MNHGESQFELSSNKSNTQVSGNDTKENKSISFHEMIYRFREFITVEPFIIATYLLSNIMASLATQKFITERGCTVDLNFPGDICYKIVEGIDDNSTLGVKDDVTSAMGNLYTWKQPLEKIIPAIIFLNIGAWSDRTGNRKAIIIVPIIGQILSPATYLAGIFLPNMPIWIFALTESIILTITSGLPLLLLGVYSYIADTTEPELRTTKMGAIGVIAPVLTFIGTLTAGPLTHSAGYIVPIAISIIFSVFGVFLTYFKIHDVNRKTEEGTICNKIVNFLNPKNFWDSFSLLALSKGKKLVQILMVLSGYIIIFGPYYGLLFTAYNYLLDRYSMNEVENSWFDSSVQIIGIIGTAVGVKLFSNTLKIHDCLLGVISTIFKTLSYFIYAFAPNRTWLYVGAVADIFGGLAIIVIRSLSTKIVDPGEVGKMCSIIACIDSLVAMAAGPLYDQVWVNYKEQLAGAHYLLASILTTPNIFIMFLLFYIDKKLRRDVVCDPDSKEKHVYDNEITSL